jgi:hypothetical protein
MPIYEISWTIGLQTNDDSGSLERYSEPGFIEKYPPVHQGEDVSFNMDVIEGGSQGQISMSQRVFSGDAKTARMYITSGNAFASQAGMVALLNQPEIDVTVSQLTVVNTENGTSVVMDGGHHVPDSEETTPATASTLRRRRGRPRRSAVVDETTMESEESEEEATEESEEAESEEEVTEESEEAESEEEESEEEVTEEEVTEEEESEESEDSEEEEAE